MLWGREAIFSHKGGVFEQMCYLCKRPSQIRSVITWGLRRGNPLVRSTLFGFVFEWAEQVGKAVRRPGALEHWFQSRVTAWQAAHLLLCV